MFINLKNFKNKLSQLFDNYSDLKERVKEKIIEQAKIDLAGYKKKEIVDQFLIKELQELKSRFNNALINLIVDYFISRVPNTTQKIYDQLKAKIDGITVVSAEN